MHTISLLAILGTYGLQPWPAPSAVASEAIASEAALRCASQGNCLAINDLGLAELRDASSSLAFGVAHARVPLTDDVVIVRRVMEPATLANALPEIVGAPYACSQNRFTAAIEWTL